MTAADGNFFFTFFLVFENSEASNFMQSSIDPDKEIL